MFIVNVSYFCLINTRKFEIVMRQYLHELMQTLKS